MSFSGKKFRRTGGSNLEHFLGSTNTDRQIKRLFEAHAPVWCFTMLDERTMSLHIQAEDLNVQKVFRLGEEREYERLDGSKLRMTYYLEGNNVLKQVIKRPDGTTAILLREFDETNAKMTITTEGEVHKAFIFYEMIQ